VPLVTGVQTCALPICPSPPSPTAGCPMADAFLLAAARTPVGKFLGALADVSAVELGAVALKAALERAEAPPEKVDEVIFGNVLRSEERRVWKGSRHVM